MFRRRRNDKKRTIPIGPYIMYLPDNDEYKRKWCDDPLMIISIDPGRTNFAFRLEERYKNGIVKTIAMSNTDIRSNEKKGVNVEYNNITAILEKYETYFDQLHIVIIEHQIQLNPDTPRVLQHVISYFLYALRNRKKRPLIFEIDASVKGRELSYNKKEDGGLKSWSIAKAKSLLSRSKDDFGLEIMKKTKKKDDLADTICQAEALAKILGLPLTKEEAKPRPKVKVVDDEKTKKAKRKFIVEKDDDETGDKQG